VSDSSTFDRLTPETQQALRYASEEAQRFNHNYIGTEHLLLGLVRQSDVESGAAATVLKNLGVELNKVRSAVEFIIGRGDRIILGEIGLTPRSQKVFELAFDEARRMNQEMVGPEHLLLGLVREGEGIAAGVLESMGVNLSKVRQEVYRVLGQPLPALENEPLEEIRRHGSRPGFSFVRGKTTTFASSQGAQRHLALIAPLMMPLVEPLHRYRPWHIEAPQLTRAAVGHGAIPQAIFGSPPGRRGDVIFGTLLGWVVVNTGGEFTLTLYDGLEAEQPLAIITNPATGAFFPFYTLVQRGLTYTFEGTPGSVTIIYDEVHEERAFP